MAYDPVSAAMRGFGGSIERLGGTIGRGMTERSGRRLEELKLGRQFKIDEETSAINALRRKGLGLDIQAKEKELADAARPYYISNLVNPMIDKAFPEPGARDVIGKSWGGIGGTGGGVEAKIEAKNFAANKIDQVVKDVLGSDYDVVPEGNNWAIRNKTTGMNFTEGEKAAIPDFDERMGAGITGAIDPEKFLTMRAKAGNGEAKQLLDNYATPEGRLEAFNATLIQKMEQRKNMIVAGIGTSTIDDNIEYLQDEIKKMASKKSTLADELKEYEAKKKIDMRYREPDEPTTTEMERSYKAYTERGGGLPIEDWRRKYWFKPEKETGELTENTVLKTISDQALLGATQPGETPQGVSAKWYGHYRDIRKKNPKMSREEAMNRTLQEMTKITLPETITKTSEALQWLMDQYGLTEPQARNWIRSQQ